MAEGGRPADIIVKPKKKSFGQRPEEEIWQILQNGRPKVSIALMTADGRGKTRTFSKLCVMSFTLPSRIWASGTQRGPQRRVSKF